MFRESTAGESSPLHDRERERERERGRSDGEFFSPYRGIYCHNSSVKVRFPDRDLRASSRCCEDRIVRGVRGLAGVLERVTP